jgi:sedoheptulose-bisphosphatase
VSPRKRAQRTLELLYLGTSCALPWQGEECAPGETKRIRTDAQITINDDVQEWDYGDYEGLTSAEIRQLRREQGIEGTWDIWRDGCPGGESPQDINARLDRVIKEIRDRFHAPAIGKPKDQAPPCDVLIVAHGHILRALAARWVGKDVKDNPALILEAGGVGTLRYVVGASRTTRLTNGGIATSITAWTSRPFSSAALSYRLVEIRA